MPLNAMAQPLEVPVLRALARVRSCAIATLAPDGSVLTWNAGCEALFGYTEVEAVGVELAELLKDSDSALANLHISCERAGQVEVEARLYTSTGMLLETFISASAIQATDQSPTAVIAIIRDVSLTKEMRHRINGVKQLEAMANAAAGIAHDINSALTIVEGYSRFVAEGALTPEQQVDLSAAVDATSRAAALSHQLLGLYGKRNTRVTVVDVGEAIQSVGDLTKRMLRPGTTLTTRVDTTPLQVRVHSGQLDRILLNLVLNARDAMPHGGVLTLSAKAAVIDSGHDLYGQLAPGSYAVITVKDTGVGIDTATRARLFEVSFTTKPEGEGSGFGLMVVGESVRELRGLIRVESEKNRGAAFNVYLPLVVGASSTAATTGAAVGAAFHDGGGPLSGSRVRPLRPSVLIVDEGPAQYQRLGNLLAVGEIEVVVAADTPQALRVMRTRAIDVLVAEPSATTLDGAPLVAFVRQHFPETACVLLADGTSLDAVVAAVNGGGVLKVLLKKMHTATMRDEIVSLALEAMHAAIRKT